MTDEVKQVMTEQQFLTIRVTKRVIDWIEAQAYIDKDKHASYDYYYFEDEFE